MEPLTFILTFAVTHGATKLVEAWTGDQDLGEIAGKLAEGLLASEARIDEQLAAIESRLAGIEVRLKEVLSQPYEIAVRTGLRILVDAVWSSDKEDRAREFKHAREEFQRASGAARSTLQRAVAERYLLWCAVGLKRDDLAVAALAKLNAAAIEAMLDAARASANSGTSLPRKRRRPAVEHAASIGHAADQAAEMASRLLSEAGLFAHESLGRAEPPELQKLPKLSQANPAEPANVLSHWLVRPRTKGPIRIGPLTVSWNNFTIASTLVEEPAEEPRPYGPFLNYTSNWNHADIASRRRGPRPIDTVPIDVTVRVESALSRPVSLWLETPNATISDRGDGREVAEARPAWEIPEGQQECTMRPTLMTSGSGQQLASACRLIVGDVLVFETNWSD